MSQRLFDSTKWMWYFFIVSFGSTWNLVNSGSVPIRPNAPPTIEAQAKFFQDFFSVQLSPYKIEFGHVCEDPNNWEQRYEKKDFENHRDMGKVRWGDKKGGYGEHYWDLNHAGHARDDSYGNDDYDNNSDDGSYKEDLRETDHEFNEKAQKYEIDEYNPDATNQYEENGRAKRAESKEKSQIVKNDTTNIEKERLSKENEDDYDLNEEIDYEEDEVTERPFKIKPKRRIHEEHVKDVPQSKEKNHIVLIVKRKQKDDQAYLPKRHEPTPLPYEKSEPKRFVPYEGGAGVRQHVHPELVPSASVPRLFLDQSTGHVVDRATGQAYVLQPIPHNIHYS